MFPSILVIQWLIILLGLNLSLKVHRIFLYFFHCLLLAFSEQRWRWFQLIHYHTIKFYHEQWKVLQGCNNLNHYHRWKHLPANGYRFLKIKVYSSDPPTENLLKWWEIFHWDQKPVFFLRSGVSDTYYWLFKSMFSF